MGGAIERVDLGHSRGWLAPAAAQSVQRIDSHLGRPLDINSAGRTPEQQQAMVDRMNAGGPFALPVGQSIHEQGNALDSDDLARADMVRLLAEHGWTRTALARGEWWHAEYNPDNDQHEGDDMFTSEDRAKLDVVYGNTRPARGKQPIGKLFAAVLAAAESAAFALKVTRDNRTKLERIEPQLERIEAALNRIAGSEDAS